jgi:hypothetical protein
MVFDHPLAKSSKNGRFLIRGAEAVMIESLSVVQGPYGV